MGDNIQPINFQEPTAPTSVSSIPQSSLPNAPQPAGGGNGLDQSVIALMHGIKQQESGGNYQQLGDKNAAGQYTAAGVGQWSNQPNGKPEPLQPGQIPYNFQADAKQFGLDPTDFSPANQNHVMYEVLAAEKAQGLSPEQIASKWNSGGANNYLTDTSNQSGSVGTYNVSNYVKNVMSYAQKYAQKNNGGGTTNGLPNAPQAPVQESVPSPATAQGNGSNTSQPEGLGQQLMGRLQNASNDLNQGISGKINPLSGVLQAVGQGAGAVGDIVNAGGNFITGGLLGKAESAIGGAIGQTAPAQAIAGSWQQFAQAHPEAAGDIGAIGNIATLVPMFKGFGLLKDAVGGTIGKVLGKDALSQAIVDVAPKETASTLADAAARRGTTKSFFTGKISVPADPAIQKMAQIVTDNVPGFSKAPDLATKLNLTQDTVSAMANDLKNQVVQSGQNKIYSFKELNAALNAIPKPIGMVKDGANIWNSVKQSIMQIAQKNGGTISSLFDARKEFDALIKQQYPNLYSSDTLTPLRLAVKNMRMEVNNFIGDNLPDVAYKNSLHLQNKLIEASDNMSSKIASGANKEIGTTRFQRFGMRHPTLKGVAKKGLSYGIGGIATGLGLGEFQHLTGQ